MAKRASRSGGSGKSGSGKGGKKSGDEKKSGSKKVARRTRSAGRSAAPARRATPGEPFRILCIDGGGIRGIVPAVLLREIDLRLQERDPAGPPLGERFDLIAGTSTGGLIALSLAMPLATRGGERVTDRVSALYDDEGPTIFPSPTWLFDKVGKFLDEKYPSKPIEGVLKRYFGDTRLSQGLTDVLVPAYAIEKRQPVFFKSKYAREDGGGFDARMRDVGRATSAAPTYFEPHKMSVVIGGEVVDDALVDGGVFANNPAMCALSEAIRNYGARLEDVLLVSLGTGHTNRAIEYDDAKDWGLAGWVRPVISVMMDGMADSVEYQCRQLLRPLESGSGVGYARINDRLEGASDDMDDATNRNRRQLRCFAEASSKRHEATIEAIVSALTA